MLKLEVEFLTGVCFAAQSQASEQPDWPIQPDRVFSALVASWAARGQDDLERRALEWLEEQSPPKIQASDCDARRVGLSYVPPNDVGSKLEAMPSLRKRQARTFPAAVPIEPRIQYFWSAKPEPSTFEALIRLARDTSYLGHSASLVRCEFHLEAPPKTTMVSSSRTVHKGRLDYLVRTFQGHQRPSHGSWVDPVPVARPNATPVSVFSTNWIIFEDDGGSFRPDLRGFPIIAKRIRHALMANHEDPIPEWISGHLANGTPTKEVHLAVAPLADVGFAHSEGRLMGFGLILPRSVDASIVSSHQDWLNGVALHNPYAPFFNAIESLKDLRFGSNGVWVVAQTSNPQKASLQAGRYTKRSRHWATLSPVVLDRYPKLAGDAWHDEVAAMLRQACVNIGLPQPAHIRIQKHSSLRGAPGAAPSGNSPSWTGWTLPEAFAKRFLVHAEIQFDAPVEGPVLIGAGRFVGLGLCIALGDRE